jgi:hypothetical protein
MGNVASGTIGGSGEAGTRITSSTSISFGNQNVWNDEFVKGSDGKFYIQPGRAWGAGGDIVTFDPSSFTSGNFLNLKVNGSSKFAVDNTGKATVSSLSVGSGNVPATATSTGATGNIAWDADFVYVCTAPNVWKRTALATW